MLRDAKFPKTVVVAHYTPAREAIQNFLTSPARTSPDFSDAHEALNALAASPTTKPWTRDDAQLCIEALKRVESAYGNTGLGSMDIRTLAMASPKLQMAGVSVSINPFASIHGKHKGESAVGCLSLLLNKTEQSTKKRMDRCRSAAILSLLFARKHLSDMGLPIPNLCLVYDVFDGLLVPAPANHKRRLDDMMAQCEEVADRWESIAPPDDYDGPDA